MENPRTAQLLTMGWESATSNARVPDMLMRTEAATGAVLIGLGLKIVTERD